MRQNEDIRAAAKRSGVYLWEVAERWGVSEFTLFDVCGENLKTQIRTLSWTSYSRFLPSAERR